MTKYMLLKRIGLNLPKILVTTLLGSFLVANKAMSQTFSPPEGVYADAQWFVLCGEVLNEGYQCGFTSQEQSGNSDKVVTLKQLQIAGTTDRLSLKQIKNGFQVELFYQPKDPDYLRMVITEVSTNTVINNSLLKKRMNLRDLNN